MNFSMKNRIVPFLIFFVLFSCKKEVNISFTEFNKVYNLNAVVELNIPKAQGEKTVSLAINSKIESHIANALSFSEENSDSLQLEEAIFKFQEEYASFKSDFEESAMVWEAMFDGEVIYQSTEVITLAINGYTNTGGAHGNMDISLYNFDATTGKILEINDIISDMDGFSKLVESYFDKEIAKDEDSERSEFFFGEPFHLPANIGFEEDGILILYNVYEIASYAQGITEFTIPFEEVLDYLKIY